MARGRKKGSKVEGGKVIQALNEVLPKSSGITIGVGKDGLKIEKEAEEGFALAKDYIKENSIPTKEELEKNPLLDPFRGVHWDVPLETKVEFFDPNLSYELTHYRPINETEGLDFDPSWFTEARDNKVRTGHYTSYRSGTKQHRDFWKEEFRRCIDGYESHGYRITGDNYFFLNYYRLKNVTDVTVTGKGRQTGFPQFFSKQYEYFHYLDLCAHVKKDACALKARGVGFSEIAASLGIRLYTVVRESHTIYCAYSTEKLMPLLRKCWEQMEFLNVETDDGMRHVRQKYNNDMHKKASKLNKQREEYGWGSDILGLVVDNPNKLRGERVDLLLFEEAGSNPVLLKTYLQSNALVEILGNKFGIRIVWGTGGDSGIGLEGLAKMFRNPEGYNVLPFKHNYTKSGDYIYSGYFIPSFTFVAGEGYIDSRGVTNTAKAKEYYEKRFLTLVENPKEYIIFKAEYCFTPDDALALEGDNIFNTELLAEQKALIELHKQGPKPEAGFLDYKFKNGIQSEENKEGFKWTSNNKSKLQILEHPIKDEAGKVFRNLYVAGIDSIDLGQRETSKATKHPSDFCIIIYKRMKGTDPPMPVAMYKDRPGDVREAYKIALRLLEYYNCKALLEFSKIGFKNYLQERKVAYKYLMFRPRATMDSEMSGSKQLGAPATEKVIQHQLELIASYVLDYCGNIWFIDIINQLLEYSYENKTKFDCVASMGMALLADEELLGVPIRQDEVIQNTWKDIGWYVDENGRKKFGTIPDKKDNQVRYNFNDLYDPNRIRTSRPNYY